MTDNTEQKEFWNDLKGDLWVELQTKIDPMLTVFDEKLLEVLDVQKGERALEIGCGTGTTTLKMADRLGPNGSIHALDFSRPMIGRAKERAVEASVDHAVFVETDAQEYQYPSEEFDLAYSRFGVMFFEDPVKAFSGIQSAMKPGGRLAYICWSDKNNNPWIWEPAQVAKKFLELPKPPGEDEPGMFSMCREERIFEILDKAGWSKIRVEAFNSFNSIGNDADEAAEFISRMGPMSEPFSLAGAAIQQKTLEAMKSFLKEYESADGVKMGFGNWVVTARKS